MAIICKHNIAGIDTQLSEINLFEVSLGIIFISLSSRSVIYDLMLKIVLDLIHHQPKLLEIRANICLIHLCIHRKSDFQLYKGFAFQNKCIISWPLM